MDDSKLKELDTLIANENFWENQAYRWKILFLEQRQLTEEITELNEVLESVLESIYVLKKSNIIKGFILGLTTIKVSFWV